MNTIQTSPLRVGNMTSSEIFNMCSMGTRDMTSDELAARPKKGKGSKTTTIQDPSILGIPVYTYIEECNIERRTGRPLERETNTRPLSWGRIAEKKGFQNLGLEYQLASDITIVHPEFDCWAGSPDANKFDEGKTVCDLKSPITIKSFVTLVKPIYELGLFGIMAMEWIRQNHSDGEKYYWQLVSNSILTYSMYAELIAYMPYRSELQDIRDMVAMIDDPLEQRPYYWIYQATDEELPWIKDDGFYKNINTIRFKVPESDKKFLLERVKMGHKLLIPRT